MLLLILAYLGGALTILSPCILPVLPFVFARPDRPFLRSGLPMLAGMALTFAAVASLAAVGSHWVSQANQIGRWIALTLMAAFALSLLWPSLAARLGAPIQSLGSRLSLSADTANERGSVGASLLLGIATGLLWAPCAGPILGLVLTAAALQGASATTTGLLLAYGVGAATSIALALHIGSRIFAALQRSLGLGEWIRRGLGVLALAAVAAMAAGLDTGLLTRLSTVSTARAEQSLLDILPPGSMSASSSTMMAAEAPSMTMSANAPSMMMSANPSSAGNVLRVEGLLPSLAGATAWLNTAPLDAASLRGKVVLVDFWTYSCINCLRALPYVRGWADKYRDQGLVVIGVHAPEFAFERDLDNVRRAVSDLDIRYPVAVDNDYAIWRGFDNQYWPAHYFIDSSGKIRAHHFGEGSYAESEQIIRTLLAEANHKALPEVHYTTLAVHDKNSAGVEMQPDSDNLLSAETYVGYARAENFITPDGLIHDRSHRYESPASLALNQWALAGIWTVGPEDAQLNRAGGKIAFRFHARDLHLVLSPGMNAGPVRFRVRIDGHAPGDLHGDDADTSGIGAIAEHRLYQLVRQRNGVGEHTFEIEFLDAGARAYAFTFG